ncbi:MAG: RDD family protein [Acidimicrobiia bacterium]|nr:RDD family protein [Acidimicrobiia bacterium]MYB10725.1 RDD family protein [Acidimicrobiia bacterium]MYG58204.1 RDD family protein [Acidimicrobiia bacterium]MYG73220.1 RDD family protein [Acidimicrobiia bacterium]MYJ32891.1 RDD family protein [Acidimicrobiia bacterium]
MSVSSWEPDPTGRHQYRWFDGEEWTDQVADDGVQSVDPLTSNEASLPRDAPPLPPPPPGTIPEGSVAQSRLFAPDPLSMLASKGRRFGAYLLEIPLTIVTLGIGYIIWMLIVWARGQTPAKQLLKMRVVRLEERRTANWGWMALRNFVLGVLIGIPLELIFPGLSILWLLANAIALLVSRRNQALWDMMLKTVVVHDPNHLFDRSHPSSQIWEDD